MARDLPRAMEELSPTGLTTRLPCGEFHWPTTQEVAASRVLSYTKRMPEFARVLLDQSTGRPLDYRIPPDFASRVQPGSRVRVPLRTRLVLGTVVSVHEETDARGVRDIASLVNDDALIRPRSCGSRAGWPTTIAAPRKLPCAPCCRS